MTDTDLLKAYSDTDYIVESPHAVTLRIGQLSPQFDRILLANGVQSAAFLTAFNPFSQQQLDDINQRAQASMKQDLSEFCVGTFPGRGQGRNANWPPEPSIVALGITIRAASHIAKKYQQNAFVWIEIGHPPILVTVDQYADNLSLKIP